MDKKVFIRQISFCLVLVILVCCLVTRPVSALTENENTSSPVVSFDSSDALAYSTYISDYKSENLSKVSNYANATEHIRVDDANIAERNVEGNNVLWWDGKSGSITWNISIQESALYNIELTFAPLIDSVDLTTQIQIDDSILFSEMNKLYFQKYWKNSDVGIRVDKKGNQLTPEQEPVTSFMSQVAIDDSGVNVDPYLVYLSAGEHRISMSAPGQELLISKIGFSAPESTVSYKDYYKKSDEDGKNKDIIYVQGEDALLKSTNSIVPKSDRANAEMTPTDPYKNILNYIGGSNWSEPGQTIIWEFDVKEEGYYRFGARYKQNEVINGESWRWLKIDGKTPFEEAKSLRFSYSAKWEYYTFSGDEEYYFWLDKGKHELSLTVTLGELAKYYDEFSKIVNILGDEYIKIVMITGENPDVGRDYELFKQIPGFEDTLKDCNKRIQSLVKDIQTSTGKRGSQYIAAMKNMSRVLDSMIDKPYNAQYYVKDYYSNYTSLCSWTYEMKSMPLAIDEIQFIPKGQSIDDEKANFFESIWFGFRRLLYSFTKDYGRNYNSNNETIRLWVNWGRDQTSILSSLIQDSFTPKTNINVKLEIVNASLVNGILAGNYPDVSLYLARTQPVNLGIRGALTDLTEFEDLPTVLERFQPGAEVPYMYNNKLYALPDTQSFYVMFYRTDVFEELNLKVPTTWQEFLHASTIIQRNNMQVYIPYTQITAANTVDAGVGCLNLYPTLMKQSGLSLYNNSLTATAIDSSKSAEVFKNLVEFYKNYDFLKEADFYNRFRVGSMPLGIAPYSTYMTLYSAAPEIKGRWSLACIPGNTNGNGTVAGAGTGCSIVKKSSHRQAAWEFLKWWTDEDTQTRYSKNVESVIGTLGRVMTSNVKALNNLSWDSNDLKQINEQWSRVSEIPEVPGSYYLSRSIDQAFWAVLNNGDNIQYTLTKWAEIADDEINKKINEYS